MARVAESARWTFDAPTTVYVDGVRHGRCSRLAVVVSPDHFAIYL
jgi:hypothetical protein